MKAAKVYFYNRLIHSIFHARYDSEFVETLYVWFTCDQFGSVFNSMKIIAAFRRNNFSTGLINVSLDHFYVHCTGLCDCFTLSKLALYFKMLHW